MNDSDFKGKVLYKLGAIEEHLKNLNGATEDNKKLAELTAKKVALHDIAFGKVGVVVTSILFIGTIALNFVIDWVKAKF